MNPTDPSSYLRVLADAFTPVRDHTGRLLGCVPRLPDDAYMCGEYSLQIAAQACVMVPLNNGQPFRPPPGFIPFDDANTDLALPVGDPDDTDLGLPP